MVWLKVNTKGMSIRGFVPGDESRVARSWKKQSDLLGILQKKMLVGESATLKIRKT